MNTERMDMEIRSRKGRIYLNGPTARAAVERWQRERRRTEIAGKLSTAAVLMAVGGLCVMIAHAASTVAR